MNVRELQQILEKNGVKLHRTDAMRGNIPVRKSKNGQHSIINGMYVHVDANSNIDGNGGH